MNKAGLMLIIAVLLWGVAVPPTKWAMESFHPFLLTFLRLVIAGGLLLPYAWRSAKRTDLRVSIPWGRMCMLSFTGVAGYFLLGYSGIALTSGVNASIIWASIPLFTLLLASLYLKERISTPQWLGLVVGIIGVLLISLHPDGNAKSSLVGDLLVLGSSFVWAVYVIQMKRPKGEEQLSSEMFTALTLAIGAVMILPFAAVETWTYGLPVITGTALFSIVFLAIGCTIFAYWLWNKGAELASAATAGAYLNALPLVSVICSILLLGESVTWRTFIGGSLVLVGVLWSERKRPSPQQTTIA